MTGEEEGKGEKIEEKGEVERGRGKSWGKQLLSHYLQWWVEVHLKPQGKR